MNMKASIPNFEGSKTYHLHLSKGDVPGYVIVPGSPMRTVKIASNWTDVKDVTYNLQYKTMTGKYKGMEQGTTSTGVGAASAEICLNELQSVGMHTCIRVGTTGSLDARSDCADMIIPLAIIRKDGTSSCYIDPGYPAYADTRVALALIEACERLGYKYGVGLHYTPGSFYLGQGRPIHEDGSGYWPSWADHIAPDLQASRVISMEMDTSGLFVIGGLNGIRMGAILTIVANRVLNTWGYYDGEEKACLAASEALKILSEWDAKGRYYEE
jgi:uridine phosphorylase